MRYYRYVNVRYHDEAVELREFEVSGETEKTVLLNDPYYLRGPKPGFRRVLKGPGHRYAYPTQEAALEDFVARKKRQMQILRGQIHRTAEALEIGQVMRKMTLLPTRLAYAEVQDPASLSFDFAVTGAPPA